MVLIAGCALLFLSLIAGACVIRSIFLIVTVEHESMLPTLQHGDRVLALRRGFRRWIRRGSIVLVAFPDAAELPEAPGLYVKRVVALSGATITLPFSRSEEKTWHIPPHHLFVCGDNRAGSVDSREWGPVPVSSIRGLILTKLRPASPQAMPRERPMPPFPPDKLRPGDPAPLFSIVSQQGENFALQDYRGKAVLLLFISAGPLMHQSLPPYLSFAHHLETLGVCTLLICDADRPMAQALVEALGIRFPVLAVFRLQHSLLEEYGVTFIPAYCLVDADGRVLASGLAMIDILSWQEDILRELSSSQSEVV
jgi:signal peptidase I